MINTRSTIFNSLLKAIKKLRKHGEVDSELFRKIMYAVVLNEMKEWAEHIGDDSQPYVDALNDYLMCNKEFEIEHILEDFYVNTNTPQDITTWQIIKNRPDYKLITNANSN